MRPAESELIGLADEVEKLRALLDSANTLIETKVDGEGWNRLTRLLFLAKGVADELPPVIEKAREAIDGVQ